MLNLHLVTGLRCTEGILKTFPDIVHRQRGRMYQIIRIEPVIAQLVKQYFE